MRSRFVWAAMIAPMLVLAGCAGGMGAGKGGDAQVALRERATERWQFLIENQYDKAYEYLSPGYRASRTQAQYETVSRSRAAFKWKSIRWIGAECETADSCLVSMDVEYQTRLPQAGDIASYFQSRERWVQSGGRWYHLPTD